jgi:hypothetical protein
MKMQGSDKRAGSGRKTWLVGMLMLATMTVASGGQKAETLRSGANPGSQTSLTTLGVSATSTPVFREIDDPQSGIRWLLLLDPGNPGGPGRLVMAGSRHETPSTRNNLSETGPAATREASSAEPPRVIHAGDRLVVEEHSPVSDVCLEAVALERAVTGKTLNVRLKAGGRVVRAVALGTGRVALMGLPEVWR